MRAELSLQALESFSDEYEDKRSEEGIKGSMNNMANVYNMMNTFIFIQYGMSERCCEWKRRINFM